MSCFRQPLAFLFLFIGFCGFARSQPSFTSWRSTITDPPGAAVTTANNATSITPTQVASDHVGNKHVLRRAYE
jgi:hypothetical protein